ncbi:hypothetical protein C2W62_50965, partial [Candidatus Entotheonella serta]
MKIKTKVKAGGIHFNHIRMRQSDRSLHQGERVSGVVEGLSVVSLGLHVKGEVVELAGLIRIGRLHWG